LLNTDGGWVDRLRRKKKKGRKKKEEGRRKELNLTRAPPR